MFVAVLGFSGLLTLAEPPTGLAGVWPEQARIKNHGVNEFSGLVKSRSHDDVFWTHHDSGHQPNLYAVSSQGEVLARVKVEGITIGDWEDIAIDDDGYLYLGDIGDNTNRRKSYVIHKIKEPDPKEKRWQVARVEWSLRYNYPDGSHDAESMFIKEKQLLVIEKKLFGRPALYRIALPDEVPSASRTKGKIDEPIVTAEKVCHLPVWHATGADIHPKGDRLAVCSYGKMWVLPAPNDLNRFASVETEWVKFPARYQIEACAFDGDDVILVAEPGQIWRVTADDIAENRTFPTGKPQSKSPTP